MADEEKLDSDLAITEAEIRAYLEEHPGMSGMEGTFLVLALEKARRRRLDLTDTEFRILANESIPRAPWRNETLAAEILAGIQARRPAPPLRGRPGAPVLDEDICRDAVLAALKRLGARGDRRPTRRSIAAEIGIDVRTLRTWRTRFASVDSELPSLGSRHDLKRR
jgi:hypothetical protein